MVNQAVLTLEERVKENLKILEYDKNKHKDLRSCFTEILKREDINRAISGIVTKSTILEETVNIIEAYEFLKENEEIMLKVLNDENEEIKSSKELSEILIYYDNEDALYRILRKNKETSQYMVIQESKYIDIGENFYTIKIDGVWVLCNMQGEILKTLESGEVVEKVTDKIIRVSTISNNNRGRDEYLSSCYFMLEKMSNGTFKQLVNIDSITDMILSSDQVSEDNKNYIFKYFLSGKKITYGVHADTIDIINNFVYVINSNDDVSYYTLDGKKIISTDSGEYCYIGELFPEDNGKKNIIKVGRYDENLNKIYTYYDLDKRQKCFEQEFTKLSTEWKGHFGLGYVPDLSIIKEDGTLIKYEKNDCFPIISDPFSEGSSFEWIMNNVKKWKDNVYIVEFVLNSSGFSGKVYALITDIEKNPKRISDYFVKYTMISSESDKMFVIPAEGRTHNFKILDVSGNLMDIIREEDSTKLQIASKEEEQQKICEVSLNNSAFLLPKYKVEKEQNNNSLIVIQKELPVNRNSNVIKMKTDDFDFSLFEGIYSTMRVLNLDDISEDGTVIMTVCHNSRSWEEPFPVLVTSEGKPVFYKRATPISIDDVGNVIWEVPYAKFIRKILTDNKGRIIIGFSMEIIPNNGLYIVEQNDSYQLFDFNGESITVPTDCQEWVKKYYVDDFGVVCDIKEKVLVTNSGYKYLLDDDGML